MANTYLSAVYLPTVDSEESFLMSSPNTRLVGVYNSYYPFGIFKNLSKKPYIECTPITILYGGNGSGKSTLLNIVAEKLQLTRQSPYSKTDFFDDYCERCRIEGNVIPRESKIITSDDIFRRLSDIHIINGSIDERRDEINNRLDNIMHNLRVDENFGKLHGLDDLDRFKELNAARHGSKSKFLRERTHQNLKSRSNGETAIEYLTDQIHDNALYLLDEPENSLSPAMQLEFKKFIEESARFFQCQFIIATHSPLLLACKDATIYNLDFNPVRQCQWNELENVKTYARFFKERMSEFE